MKQTRLILLLIIACFIAAIPAEAQQRHGRQGRREHREKMRAELREFKLKYLAQEMELNADDQPKFIEVYDRMCAEKQTLLRPVWRKERELRKKTDATEEEYDALAEQKSKAMEEELKIDRKYEKEFGKFLTSKQIFKMREAEQTFNNKMREMRGKRKKGR